MIALLLTIQSAVGCMLCLVNISFCASCYVLLPEKTTTYSSSLHSFIIFCSNLYMIATSAIALKYFASCAA